MKHLQSGSSRNNFNQFASNDGLSGSVECKGQFVDHFGCVFAGVVHGRHTGRLFTASTFLKSVVDQSRQRKLQIALYYVAVQGVIDCQFWCRLREVKQKILYAKHKTILTCTASWLKTGNVVVVQDTTELNLL